MNDKGEARLVVVVRVAVMVISSMRTTPRRRLRRTTFADWQAEDLRSPSPANRAALGIQYYLIWDGSRQAKPSHAPLGVDDSRHLKLF